MNYEKQNARTISIAKHLIFIGVIGFIVFICLFTSDSNPEIASIALTTGVLGIGIGAGLWLSTIFNGPMSGRSSASDGWF